MTVVTRFAPSPTGYLHIGGARTALFSWLYAKRHGGKFLLRIEDTDRERSTEDAVDAIVQAMKWLELDWDGEASSQFEGRDRHAEVAHQLVEAGKAYYCYCSPEELEEMREKARETGAKTFYDRRWRDADPSTAPKGIKPVVRIKAPLEGSTTVEDKVQGSVTVQNDQLDDFIILRSDGTPTYMLSVVVDDYDAGVTHVIRGDDHLNNTFRQMVIYNSMGWNLPTYAHVPLIHGPDGKKLSKRHGALGAHEYEAMGYLPEAMRNYLLRLGWSHGDDEIIPTEQAIEWFDLDHISKSPARLDFDKLNFINRHYMEQAEPSALVEMAIPYIEKLGLNVSDDARGWIAEGLADLLERAQTLPELAEGAAFYAKVAPFDFDDKAKKNLDDDGKAILQVLLDGFKASSDLSAEKVEEICREVAKEHRDGKLGKVMMPLRGALTGVMVSPSVFHIVSIMGLAEVEKRIVAAINS